MQAWLNRGHKGSGAAPLSWHWTAAAIELELAARPAISEHCGESDLSR